LNFWGNWSQYSAKVVSGFTAQESNISCFRYRREGWIWTARFLSKPLKGIEEFEYVDPTSEGNLSWRHSARWYFRNWFIKMLKSLKMDFSGVLVTTFEHHWFNWGALSPVLIDWGISQKRVTVAISNSEIWIRHLWHTSLQRSYYTNLLGWSCLVCEYWQLPSFRRNLAVPLYRFGCMPNLSYSCFTYFLPYESKCPSWAATRVNQFCLMSRFSWDPVLSHEPLPLRSCSLS
jgi:hypothetical protein